MTDEEKGKAFFEFTNRSWSGPNKLKWEQLTDGVKYIWIQRAKHYKEKT